MTLDPAPFHQLWLGLARAGAFLFMVPWLGGPRVPGVVKVGTALALSVIGLAGAPGDAVPPTSFTVLLVKEVAVGLVLGWGVMLAFAAVQAAGHLIEVQYGFGVGAIIDPMHSTETTVVAQFYVILATILVLAVDGHHLLFRLVARSYQVVPLGVVPPAGALAGGAFEVFKAAFIWGLQIAGPMLVASLLIEASLGLVARAVPQMNVFIVSLPLKLGVGMALIGLMLPTQLGVIASVMDAAAREGLAILGRGRP